MSARRWLPVLALALAIPAANAQPTPKQAPPTPKQAPPTPKQAPPPVTVSCDFLEITASSGAAPSVDPALVALSKKFKKPPFSSWNVFKLDHKEQKALQQKKLETVMLKKGQVEAKLFGIVNKSQVRLSIALTVSDKNIVNTTATFEGGDYLVYGHSLPNNDGHLLALTCK